MGPTLGNRTKSLKYIHLIIILAFMFGFQFLPPIGTISPLGMKTLGVFFGVIYGWSTMDMIWPSLLGLFALSLSTGEGAIETFKAGFGDRITVAIFLFLLFGELVSQVGLSNYIADWCVRRKFVRGKPYGILAMFCLAGAFISAFVNVFAGMIIMWGIFYSFCHDANLRPGDPYARVALIAIIFVCTMAGNLLPFMGSSILVVGLQQQILGIDMPYVTFTIMQLFMIVLASVFYFIFIKFVVKPDTTVIESYVPNDKQLVMTSQQKLVFALLVGLLVVLFLPGLLPADLTITKALKGLDISGLLAIVFVLYYVINLTNGKAVPFNKIAEGVNWNLILMFATVAPLTTAISNEEAGIMAYVSALLKSFVSDMNPIVFTLIILLIASIITQFCNNVAIVLVTVPLMYSFAVELGANPVLISILVAFNLNVAFCTPAASGPAAMVFSNKEFIGQKAAFTHGLVIFVINMVVTVIGLYVGLLFV